jgi:hypothetical protein
MYFSLVYPIFFRKNNEDLTGFSVLAAVFLEIHANNGWKTQEINGASTAGVL